ncbi:MAG: hypothetical protein HY671_03080 [Chloroflexi bacterium]|nr:hypothetical protein [Chloroflexota bacterium]
MNCPPPNLLNAMFSLNTPEETLRYFLVKVMSEGDATRFMSLNGHPSIIKQMAELSGKPHYGQPAVAAHRPSGQAPFDRLTVHF